MVCSLCRRSGCDLWPFENFLFCNECVLKLTQYVSIFNPQRTGKKDRLEDLGRLYEMLKTILDDEIFEHTDSKHGYESWVKINHDKIDYYDGIGGEIRGLDHIFCKIRYLEQKLQECKYLASGLDDDN